MNQKTQGASKLLNFNHLSLIGWESFGSDGWNRTTDLGVMNPTL